MARRAERDPRRARERRRPAPATAGVRVPVDARSSIVAIALAATLAALLERWWFPRAWHEADALGSAFYYGDVAAFRAFAEALADGRLFDNGIPFHPPGWPFLLAAGTTVVGFEPKSLTAILGALTVGLSTLLTARLAGPGAAAAAGTLGAFHFGHLVISTTPNAEALYGCLIAATLLIGAHWLVRPRTDVAPAGPSDGGHWGWGAATGAVGALAALVRAEFLLGLAVLTAVAVVTGARRRAVLAFGLAASLVLLPTTVWHWQNITAFNEAHPPPFPGPLPRFAPVTAYGAFNFAMANHERADGEPNRDHPWLDACHAEMLDAGFLDLACPSAHALFVDGYRIGLSWIATHPLDAAALWWRKSAMAVGFLAHGYGIENLGAGVDGARRRVDVLDPEGRWLIPIHLALLWAGLGSVGRHRGALALFCVPLVTLAASTWLYYGYVRLGLAYLPALWAVQGAGLARLLSRVAPSAFASRGPAVALIVMSGFVVMDAASARGTRGVVLEGPRGADGRVIEDETVRVRRVAIRGPR